MIKKDQRDIVAGINPWSYSPLTNTIKQNNINKIIDSLIEWKLRIIKQEKTDFLEWMQATWNTGLQAKYIATPLDVIKYQHEILFEYGYELWSKLLDLVIVWLHYTTIPVYSD